MNQIYAYFPGDPTENDKYYLRLWISKSCFDVLSHNTRETHGDQLVEVMLDHLLRLLRSSNRESAGLVNIYAGLYRYPSILEIRVKLNYAVCTLGGGSIQALANGTRKNHGEI